MLQDASQGPAAGQVWGPRAAGDQQAWWPGSWGPAQSVTDGGASSRTPLRSCCPHRLGSRGHQNHTVLPAPSPAGSSGPGTGRGPDGHGAPRLAPECSRSESSLGSGPSRNRTPKALPGPTPSIDSSSGAGVSFGRSPAPSARCSLVHVDEVHGSLPPVGAQRPRVSCLTPCYWHTEGSRKLTRAGTPGSPRDKGLPSAQPQPLQA